MPREFAFDVILTGTIRVTAASEQDARAMLFECIECADANLGAWPNGDPILAEVSLREDPVRATDIEETPCQSCSFVVGPDDSYHSSDCGTFCRACMAVHTGECESCDSEFGGEFEDDKEN